MKIHLGIAGVILLSFLVIKYTLVEVILIIIAICLVLITEMLNTCVEFALDMVSTKYHPKVREIKDIAAGAVLIASLCAFVIGCFTIFLHITKADIELLVNRIRDIPTYLVLASLGLVSLVVVGGKLLFKRGTLLRGGVPSGHAAVAFSVWVAVAFISKHPLVILLTLALTLLISQSRVKEGIHTIGEVALGAILGILATLLIFQLLG
jgi:diacylglycerol kinase (ATP)